ncbi:hypothetical protein ACFX19_001917 [Malus domestica]
MNWLHWLTSLKLEGCKGLKSIPEISSTIRFIDAHDCTALVSVSRPSKFFPKNLYLTFSNCFQLVQNLFEDVVEAHQGNPQPLSLFMYLPGSKLSDWFSHQCSRSSESMHDERGFCFDLLDLSITRGRLLESDYVILGHQFSSIASEGVEFVSFMPTPDQFHFQEQHYHHENSEAELRAFGKSMVRVAHSERNREGCCYNEGEQNGSDTSDAEDLYSKRLVLPDGAKEN